MGSVPNLWACFCWMIKIEEVVVMRSRLVSKIFITALVALLLQMSASMAFATSNFAAWFGTNNTTGYNTPTADGLGGTVDRNGNTLANNTTSSPSHTNSSTSTGNTPINVNPASGYRIKSISWCDAGTGNSWNPGSWTPVTVASPNTGTTTFNINRNDRNYMIWVVFESTAAGVYTQWGIDNSWDGTGGSVTASNKTVQNQHTVTPAFADHATVTFTVTPTSGYVIDKIEWLDNTSVGFAYGTGTVLTLDANGRVSFTMSNNKASFQVRFVRTAEMTLISYYGTNAIGATPNWIGGQVYRTSNSTSNSTNDELGSSTYQVYSYSSNGTKYIRIDRDTAIAPGYTIGAVGYAQASWTDPSNVTAIGSVTSVTPDSNGRFSFSTSGTNSYIIYVQFNPPAAIGGKIGAWYGTNNTTGPDTPSNADGNGGTVWKTSGGTVQLTNRVADSVSRSDNGNITLEARPASGFRIISINYKQSGALSWTPVTLGAADTAVNSFNVYVSGGNSYVVWVVYASTALDQFTVTGTVSTDSITQSCGTSTVSPQSIIVNRDQTGSFTLSTSTNCVPDTVVFNGGASTTIGISGDTYTTPPITATSNFVMKFKPVGYKINAYIDSSSPTGSGSITPASVGNVYVDVVKGGSQTFTIAPNTGYSISHVYVTDTNRGYSNFDIAPLSTNTYTFTNIQADGVIRVAFVASVPVAGNDYCQIPPFVQGQTNLSPNVLIIFDNSGSMSDYTYNGVAGKNYNCTASHNATTNLCDTIYYGYFDPYTMYKTDSNTSPGGSNVYLIDNVTLNLSSTNGKSGNYLNYRNMSKVDIVRKILVGGRVTGKGSTTLTGRGTTNVKYLYTDNGQWVQYGTGEPTGIIQNLQGKVRFGLEVLGNNAGSNTEGGQIIAKLGSSTATLVTAIEGSKTNPVTNTPMAEALYEAVRYFQAKPSAYNTSTDYGDTTWNPIADPIIQYACQKHFVIILTDGEPNSNDNLPGLSHSPSLNGYTDGVFDVTTWESRITANDRADNTNSTCSTVTYPCPSNSASCPNSEKLEAVAYYAHNTDLRSSTFGNDLPGNQNLTIYPVYAFGTGAGRKTLHMTAKYGAYESRNGNNAGTAPNQYASPDQALEWDKNGDCVPDAYFEADDGAILEAGIQTVISNILANVASGTAASILSNSEGSGASLLQAVYYPNKIFKNSTEVKWIGEMHNLWYYIDPYLNNNSVREDTVSDKILNLSNDKVANFNFDGTQTTIDLLADTYGNGKTLVSSGTVGLDEVTSLWRAGRQLQARTASTRTIHTSINGSTLGLYAANTGGGFYAALSRAGALQPYLQTANNDSLAETNKLINYIRGDDQSNYRTRKVSLLSTDAPSNWKEWKLGDIITSTPQVQSNIPLNGYHTLYGDTSYRKYIYSSNYSKRGMVYVGANDGMLHAFKLGKLTTGTGVSKATLTGGTDLGEEQWAYIPRNALPYLKYLADTNYAHLFYTDGPIVMADVSVNIPSGCSSDYADCQKDTTNGTNWSTVLIGSMGLGGASALKGSTCVTGAAGTCVQTPILDPTNSSYGIGYSSYFAFDIANQYFNDGATTSANSTLNAQPVFKWEFSPPGLGYATSGASIVRVSGTNSDGTSKSGKNGKWFAVFASGPTGPINTSVHNFVGKSDQNLKIFVVDLGASAPLVLNTSYWVLDSGVANAFGGSISNSNTDADKSNLSSPGYYQDDVIYVGYTRANATTITNTTEWNTGGVLRILTKEDPNPSHWTLSKVIDGIGPVTGAIDTLQDKNEKKFWLYFGSGRFYYVGDDSSSQRYIFGVQDRCYTTNNVFDKTCNTTAVPGTDPIATGQGGTLALSDLTNQSTSISSTIGKGWYIKLRAEDSANFNGAERVTTRPAAQKSGAVFYTTLQPTSDVCKYGGTTHLWSVNYKTGDIPSCSALGGTTVIQMTTGAFEQVKFSDLFVCKNTDGSTHSPPAPPTTSDGDPVHITAGGGTSPGFGSVGSSKTDYRSTAGVQGGTGGDGISPPVMKPLPRKEILHIKEK
jgi:type IV pilus assembly protein PilY1